MNGQVKLHIALGVFRAVPHDHGPLRQVLERRLALFRADVINDRLVDGHRVHILASAAGGDAFDAGAGSDGSRRPESVNARTLPARHDQRGRQQAAVMIFVSVMA